MSEKHHPYRVEIQNVVAVASIEQNIDLKAITRAFMNVDYRPCEHAPLRISNLPQ